MPSRSDPAEAITAAVAAIASADAAAAAEARARQDRLTKPPGALGRLEELAVRIAGMRGCARPRLDQRLVVVAAADHGVAARGVSAYPPEVTAQMVANFIAGGAAINVLADHAGARVRVVDAGVLSTPDAAPGLVRLDLPRGSGDITRGPAMSRETAERAIAAGVALVENERRAPGLDIVGCGEMGIGNSTAAAALIAAACGRPAAAVTGRGSGVEGPAFEAKVAAVEAALAANRPDREDGVALLAALGGHEIGVLAGVYLGAAAARIPAVMDGLISGAAALVAVAIAPGVRDYIVASHRSPEPGHGAVLETLEAEPLLDLGMRLGEGSGAALGISLCVAACRVLDEMATFGEAGVSDAGPQ
ncbi:MAG: nicotinate-nucleotide--dimethylbenzimidazole phosphoribosyltransferase [Chloroflexi bacterium]|nr:nicotinate-nucleotide--dimethylbenzimidazole phosphoribosyltransferase [Chloroflexota bacterium]